MKLHVDHNECVLDYLSKKQKEDPAFKRILENCMIIVDKDVYYDLKYRFDGKGYGAFPDEEVTFSWDAVPGKYPATSITLRHIDGSNMFYVTEIDADDIVFKYPSVNPDDVIVIKLN